MIKNAKIDENGKFRGHFVSKNKRSEAHGQKRKKRKKRKFRVTESFGMEKQMLWSTKISSKSHNAAKPFGMEKQIL